MDDINEKVMAQIQHVVLSNLTASLQDHRAFVVIYMPAHV
jgi:hypothetical protein